MTTHVYTPHARVHTRALTFPLPFTHCLFLSLSFFPFLSFSPFHPLRLSFSFCFARPRLLVFSFSLAYSLYTPSAYIGRRRRAPLSRAGRTRTRTESKRGCENGGGWLLGARGEWGEHGARGDARAAAKRGHRRSSHYDNGDRRGVSAHP